MSTSSHSMITTTTTVVAMAASSLSGTEDAAAAADDDGDIASLSGKRNVFLPWILGIGCGLVLVWIVWMMRRYINRKCCGGNGKCCWQSFVRGGGGGGGQRSRSRASVHWQWISTGNPHSRSFLSSRSNNYSSTESKSAAATGMTREEDPFRMTESVNSRGLNIWIGGDLTPRSGMTPIASQPLIFTDPQQQQRGSLSRLVDLDQLLRTVGSIYNLDVKRDTFQLTFDTIQLGAWTPDEWHHFTRQLFIDDDSQRPNDVADHDETMPTPPPPPPPSGHDDKRAILDEWLRWRTLEKADMRDVFEALQYVKKADVAYNAALSVSLELRLDAGSIPSSEYSVDAIRESIPEEKEEERVEYEDDEEEEEDDLTLKGSDISTSHSRESMVVIIPEEEEEETGSS